MVCLLPSSLARHSPLGSSQSHDGSSTSGSPVLFEELEYHEPVCKRHYTQQDFSEADYDPDTYKIPFVAVSLKAFSAHVHSLLQSHEGTIPLLSFLECYASEFSPLTVAEEGKLEGSVPLEHLITCIPGITIVTAQNGFKVIKWIHNKPPPPNADPWLQRCKSPVGNPQLIQFSREIIDLMKNQPCCLMPITKFIPAYHHHFAKQCRVSDYGFSKLLELLEAVPHVLQILGLGSKRLLTLTHRAQVKRFTQDLLKLLKFQASKQSGPQRRWNAPDSLGRRWWICCVTNRTFACLSASSSPLITTTLAASASSPIMGSLSSWSCLKPFLMSFRRVPSLSHLFDGLLFHVTALPSFMTLKCFILHSLSMMMFVYFFSVVLFSGFLWAEDLSCICLCSLGYPRTKITRLNT
ncbi:meiosis regulator and mRNA stability factor 1-like isoform X1 [Tachysurus fulvidraco]|uniref:meiosis regulator and mRNA stability factor 1-like isoform X1 n=1 Tax=Tachysurus fulvidraco TaxID=1234273 RepID=UPI001FEFEAB4|nr:meiosis regulator and mRNA stability factor 1-like isoform X1 [Tachysurus fulvidraco]XP_047670114.1 meiosis regulator and mRNA stability factor 1-like isoform X1 [Tachysurus fulvidraco]XP_047670115.1 meiosis regulator and mRNA stability factor 1-like isoform X1 [Tachysurus fulvidraco]